MADLHNYNKRGHQRSPLDKRYMVDTRQLHDLSLYQGNDKPPREMITKVIIWTWWGFGLPCWIGSVITSIFGWVHLSDVKEFIVIMVGGILGLLKALVIWSEKGDAIEMKIKAFFKKKRRQRIK